MIIVIRPGMLDLVMDLGRPGLRMQGVPEGGAADAPSLIHGNRLVGNPDNAAGLELTLMGPELEFLEEAVIALTGADMAARMGKQVLKTGQRHVMQRGARLKFGTSKSGARAYLAVAGGVDAPMVLGSRSTFLPGGWGGWQGRALKSGDMLLTGKPGEQAPWLRIPEPSIKPIAKLRVLPGPQLGGFSDAALAGFLQHVYRVDTESSRVGIRLQGPVLDYRKGEISSQAVLPGTIQITPAGQPIILGWDGPVTGGYPVIAGVITADLPGLAQLKPGDSVSFRVVDADEARLAWKQANTWTG